MNKRILSLRYHILIIILLVSIPILFLFIFFNYRVRQEVRQADAETNQNILNSFISVISKEQISVDSFLNQMFREDSLFRAYDIGFAGVGDDHYAALTENIEEVFSSAAEVSGAALINFGREESAVFFNGQMEYNEERRKEITGYLSEISNFLEFRNGWYLQEIGEHWYWFRPMNLGNSIMLFFMDISKLGTISQTEYALENPVVFQYGNELLNSAVWVNNIEEEIKVVGDYSILGTSKKYMVCKGALTGLNVYYASAYRVTHGALKWLSMAPFIILLTVLLILIVVSLYVNYMILEPMDGLVHTMKEIQGGNLQARSRDYKSRELAYVNQTFNNMISMLNQLKIENYENKIVAQEAEMDALRMQIRPHFYLNNLKNLFGLAQIGATEKIQENIVLLSNHLRYTFSFDCKAVPLSQEISLCQNYMELQRTSTEKEFAFYQIIDSQIQDFEIPPITLLTLIENSVKYGTKSGKILKVEITGKQLSIDNEEIVYLVIRDNGKGFSEELMERLNQLDEKSQNGSNVGILNVIRRCRLFYGSSFAMYFSNRDGAQIELFIPRKREEESV